MSGRKSRLTPRVALRMAKLWPTDTTTREMGVMFGVCSSRVSRWARLLGFPRKPHPEHRRDKTRIVAANRARRVLEEIEKGTWVQMEYEPVVAKWWRCPHCPGRSSSREGHELCVNRVAA